MTVSATPLQPCPTPQKKAYRSRGAALAGFITGVCTHEPPHAYRCRCGKWHITGHLFVPNDEEQR
jgi:hypothetical protein